MIRMRILQMAFLCSARNRKMALLGHLSCWQPEDSASFLIRTDSLMVTKVRIRQCSWGFLLSDNFVLRVIPEALSVCKSKWLFRRDSNPRDEGVKVHCLTAWLRNSKRLLIKQPFCEGRYIMSGASGDCTRPLHIGLRRYIPRLRGKRRSLT